MYTYTSVATLTTYFMMQNFHKGQCENTRIGYKTGEAKASPSLLPPTALMCTYYNRNLMQYCTP